MGFLKAVASSYTNILSFTGRASRSEFWWVMLFQTLATIGLSLGMIAYFTQAQMTEAELAQNMLAYNGAATIAWLILFTIPATTLLVRRLHDTDRSGWWYWIAMIPFIGAIILLVFLLQRGSSGRNRYGHDPLNPASRRRNAPKTYAPEIMAKRAKTEAARRAEIMDYYRKNVVNTP